MKNIKRKLMAAVMSTIMLFSVSSCDLFDTDINTDPNNPTEAALDLLLANVMLNASSTFAGNLNDATQGFMAINTSFDDFNMTNGSWNNTWNYLYSNPLADLEKIILATEEAGNNPHYLGVAQVLKAYYFSIMVDLWGDVPYNEAFSGDAGNKLPAYTDDAEIYADLIQLTRDAEANFALTSAVDVNGDLIYGGDIDQWITVAKTLRLRLLLQTSTVNSSNASEINSLYNDGDLILSSTDDFTFQFGRLQNPDDRHPMYQDGYASGEAAYSYFGHQLMVEMLENRDPRTPFYFKRQTTVILNPDDPSDKQTIPCSQRTDCTYGYLVSNNAMTNRIYGKDASSLTDAEADYLAGFFGRDRSDPSGIPNDNLLRTTVGAYPAAGLFDDVAETAGDNQGAGNGIFPMISSWMTYFYMLEAQIRLTGVNTGMTDAELLEAALTAQMDKVLEIGQITGGTNAGDVANWGTNYSWPVTYTDPTTYIANIVAGYPSGGTTNQKLQYVMKQAWYANFGNGFEIYNAFRRTGYPADLQTPLQRPRQFALRLPYAQTELNLNGSNTPSVTYDSPGDAIFWDVVKFQF
ncbi:MAG: SusD/RagB family nutrient-binding outer membrane lipoprotein [Fulvivirga sp.]